MGDGLKRAVAAAKATRKQYKTGLENSLVKSRFAAFNPDERQILQTLLQNHANTVSEILLAVEGPIDIHAYLATIEALENECKRG